ncbi:FGGY carbohydrate kinase domain-containing protein [Ischnura elegans]|uniref:FGGY carbohydrate kinase domain-containing protein n=1 Tax=Ischnura elegans TaxID=197161 RepID=UPI001ED87DB2|nr:FGGY carbohydrate kinase domain-containing protein [Ischnura elegans]
MMSKTSASRYFVGVDVGTGSVRAALVSSDGKVVSTATKDITTWTPKPGYFEQSSDDIWNACCHTIKAVTKSVPADTIKGLGFDATCSLVVLDGNGLPVTVSPTGNKEHNVILWLDHRAELEAKFINSLKHPVLHYVGGTISPEMETPKLLWLKKNARESCWNQAQYFFDLPDFLTWKATGVPIRSLCSVVCKWTYQAGPDGNEGWSVDYFQKIGLEDLVTSNFEKIGSIVVPPGTPVGSGLSQDVAKLLNLMPGTAVGSSMIDAHAGALATMACSPPPSIPYVKMEDRLGLICGTSTCHMALSYGDPLFVDGVWGPYWSALLPGVWLNEGGQSATGKLIDHLVSSHPASSSIMAKLPPNKHIQGYLNELLARMAADKGLPSEAELTNDFHVWPDFHGNRSPLADPSLLGMISGLGLSSNEESLALLYLATVQALVYGTRHIIEKLEEGGHSGIKALAICGGLAQNSLVVKTHADALNLPIICPIETESVLVGAAILGANAYGENSSLNQTAQSMGGMATAVLPRGDALKRYHDKKYKVFLRMVQNQREYRSIMAS